MAKWEPDLAAKQLDFYRSDARTRVAVGPRYTGKTWVLEHAVFQHCWRHEARFAFVPKTTRVSKSGVWAELTGKIYDEWKAAGVCSEKADFGWTREPWTDPVTKVLHAELWNRHGTKSQIQVFPIQFEHEAEDRVFSTQFSGFWLSEAHLWPTDRVYEKLCDQIRLPGVSFDDQLILIDANPPATGKKHWLYSTFLDPFPIPEDKPEEVREQLQYERSKTRVWKFYVEDNPKGDQRALRAYAARYANKPLEYARYVEGKWVDGVEAELIFSSVWNETTHVVGDISAPDERDWQVMAPSNGLHAQRLGGMVTLVGGWDPGSVNHAWVGVQPWTDASGRMCVDVLDEHVLVGEKVSVREFARGVKKKVDVLEELAGFPITWQDFSDSSAMVFRAAADVPMDADATDAAIIGAESEGKHRLIGSAHLKKPGWQKRRADFLSEMLMQGRIRVSAQCLWVKRMFEKLRRDMSEKPKGYVASEQEEKHVFDALSYAVCSMFVDELLADSSPRVVSSRVMRV